MEQNREKTPGPGGISADAAKITALVSMLIDHIGAVIIGGMLRRPGLSGDSFNLLINLYYLFRIAGRLAFPLYCYLLVTGFIHTRHYQQYVVRMGVFAFISEIPFDLALRGELTLGIQNIFFTLLIGLLVLEELKRAEALAVNDGLKFFSQMAITVAGMTVAGLLRTDYSYKGILLISLLYCLRSDRTKQCFYSAACFLFSFFLGIAVDGQSSDQIISALELECFSLFSFVLIFMCNGRRSTAVNKYFFYLFYPAHLFVLYLIARMI